MIYYYDVAIHLLTPVALILFMLWLYCRRRGGIIFCLRWALWSRLRYVWLALGAMLFIYHLNSIIPRFPQPSTGTLITLGLAATAIRKVKP